MKMALRCKRSYRVNASGGQSFIALLRASQTMLLVLIATLSSMMVRAQDVGYLTGDLFESYSGETRIGGPLLVGVWSGTRVQRFNPAELRVHVPRHSENEAICFEATTRDGLYYASGELQLPSQQRDDYLINAYQHSEYQSRLNDYAMDDVAPLATIGRSCDATEAYLVSKMSADASRLFVSLNVRGGQILSAALVDRSEQEIDGECAGKREARSLSFDQICRFSIGNRKMESPLILSVKRKPRSGPKRVDEFTILFP